MTDIKKQDIKNGTFLGNANSSAVPRKTLKVFKKLSIDVSANPNNLIMHTQRILYCIDNNLSELLCGSLQDLFITLQGKGQDLRLRLFNLISPYIDHLDRAYFQQWLSEGSDENLECRRFDGSIFTSKTCNSVSNNS